MARIIKESKGIVFIRVDKTTIWISVASFVLGTVLPILIQWAVGSLDDSWYIWLIFSFSIATWVFLISGYCQFNRKLSKQKNLKNDYSLAISKIIDAIDSKNEIDIQKYSEHLNAIINMQENLVDFKPDSEAYESLHNMKGALSITDAHPLEWLNPTYNFFLISHYVSAIHHSFEMVSSSGSDAVAFNIVDRDASETNQFFENGLELLNKLSNVNNMQQLQNVINGNHLRFYILDKETIKKNSGVIELLIAGHEMFGIHLYVVDKKIYNILHRETLYKKIFNTKMEEATVFDAMFSLNKNGQLSSSIAQTGTLVTNQNKREQNQELQKFVTDLAKSLRHESEYAERYLLYPCVEGGKEGLFDEEKIEDFKITFNEKMSHICFQKKQQ